MRNERSLPRSVVIQVEPARTRTLRTNGNPNDRADRPREQQDRGSRSTAPMAGTERTSGRTPLDRGQC